MEYSKAFFKETFGPLPQFHSLPETVYTQKWKYNVHPSENKLFLTVVDNPSMQLMMSEKKVKRYSTNKFIVSSSCVPINAVKCSWHKKYAIDRFRSEPFTPFIPDLLLHGINQMEAECHYTGDWNMYYTCNKKADKELCNDILEFYVKNPKSTDLIKEKIKNCTIDNLALCVLRFFTIFETKVLHFDTCNLLKILKEPLYDKFLRPNTNIKNIVRACVLKCSRTKVDTLAFLMIHILHIWEYSNIQHKTKIKLSRLFGPRIISFEDPVYLYNIEDATSPQSAMLEAVLEICDAEFWMTLNFNQRKEVFDKETILERKRDLRSIPRRDRPLEFAYMCNPYSLFPLVNKSSRANQNDEEYKSSTFYKRLLERFK